MESCNKGAAGFAVRPEGGQALLGRTRAVFPACFALAALVAVTFFLSPWNGFVNYDDYSYVVDNPQVRDGISLEGVAWAFSSTWAGNWHPLTWISHMIDCSIFGLNPGGHHLAGLALHGANTLVLFLLLLEMTGALGRSLFVAALFAVHPLHVESVAWIAERKDLLSAFFVLLSIWAYMSYARGCARSPGSGRAKYLTSLALFAAALMAKPMAVTLPFLLLLLDYWPIRRTSGRAGENFLALAREKTPFFILSTFSALVTLHAQQGSLWSLEELPFPLRLANALLSYFHYLEKTIRPAGLAVFYPYPDGIDPAAAVLAAVSLAAITFAVVRWGKDLPFLPVGWLWFAVSLLPVIGLVQAGSQAMADRYTYLPLVGIFIILAWGSESAFRHLRIGKAAAAACGATLICLFAVQSCIQVSCWRNSFTLFSHALDVTSGNYVARNNLGMFLAEHGRLAEAEEHFREAIRIWPGYLHARYNLALARQAQGKLEQAISGYRDVLEQANCPGARLNMANALIARNKLDEAGGQLARLIEEEPGNARALNNLGIVRLAQGRTREALVKFGGALAADPGNPVYLRNFDKARKEIRSQQHSGSSERRL